MIDSRTKVDHPAPSRGRGRRQGRWLALLALVLLGSGGVAWWLRPAPVASPVPRDEPDLGELVRVTNPGFVGARVCGECHGPRLHEFEATRHFRACTAPEPGLMPPGFTPESVTHASRHPGLRFAITRSGGDFLQTVLRDTPAGTRRFPHRVDLVYGAGGKADEVYFSREGDRLFELPMAWLHPQKRWGEQTFNPNTPGDFTRPMTLRCVECHNTWVEHVPGTENQYAREGLLLGVTCEKCHGPGREHVDYHRRHPDAEAHAIAHPGELSRERQMDLCGQCHSNAVAPRTPPFSYRPGEPLEAHFRTLLAAGLENDHVANQVKYLRQSKCFQKSEMTCITCHDPHKPTDTRAVERACLECHRPSHCRERERLPDGVREDCVGCHMPRQYRVAVKFHTPDDQYVFPLRPHEHRIAVYPAARQEALLQWHRGRPDAGSREEAGRLARSLVEHWLKEGEDLKRQHRYLAAIGAFREAVRVDPTPAAKAGLKEVINLQAAVDTALIAGERQFNERRPREAIEALEGLLKLKPDHAKAHGKLGLLYSVVGQREKADEHLREVAKHDPDDASGWNMLGWLAYLDGRGEAAAEAFRRADEILPVTAEINYRWGLALLAQKTWPEAAARFRVALRVNPNHAGAHQGLSHALRGQHQFEEARRHARRAAGLTHFENLDVLLSLADACADAGKPAEAKQALERALGLAQTSSPELLPRIQRRLAELR